MNSTVSIEDLEIAVIFWRISNSICLAFWSILFGVEFLGLCESVCFAPKEERGKNKFLRVFLFCNGLCTLFALILMQVQAFIPDISPLACDVTMRVNTGIYNCSVGFGYLFLLEKINLIKSLTAHDRIYAKLLKLVKIGIAVLIPMMLIPLGASTFSGKILEGNVCVMVGSTWTTLLFTVGNFGLTAAMTYLFVKPLKTNARLLHATKLEKIANRNAYLSMIAIITTVTATCVMAAVSLYVDLQGNYYEFLRVYSYEVMVWDLIILGTCSRLTNFGWLPTKTFKVVCDCFSRSKVEVEEVTTQIKSTTVDQT